MSEYTTHTAGIKRLERSTSGELPATAFLEPLLGIRLPDGVGMTFAEEMVGYYFPGLSVPAGREGDMQIEAKLPPTGQPAGSVAAGVCFDSLRLSSRCSRSPSQ